MAEIPEIELKMTMDYDPKQVYKDTSNNYIKILYSIKAYQEDELYVGPIYQNKIYLKVLYSNGDIKGVQMILEDFEDSLMTGEIKKYFPDEIEEAKLVLKGF